MQKETVDRQILTEVSEQNNCKRSPEKDNKRAEETMACLNAKQHYKVKSGVHKGLD